MTRLQQTAIAAAIWALGMWTVLHIADGAFARQDRIQQETNGAVQ